MTGGYYDRDPIDKMLKSMATRIHKTKRVPKPTFDDLAVRLKPRETLGDAVLKNWKDEN